jgi:hypothetical protein
MRHSMTVRLDQGVLDVARLRARAENRTLTNYIETLIKTDIAANRSGHIPLVPIDPLDDTPMTIFIAEPLGERLVTDIREDDQPEDVARRQEYLDRIAGWGDGA